MSMGEMKINKAGMPNLEAKGTPDSKETVKKQSSIEPSQSQNLTEDLVKLSAEAETKENMQYKKKELLSKLMPQGEEDGYVLFVLREAFAEPEDNKGLDEIEKILNIVTEDGIDCEILKDVSEDQLVRLFKNANSPQSLQLVNKCFPSEYPRLRAPSSDPLAMPLRGHCVGVKYDNLNKIMEDIKDLWTILQDEKNLTI